MEIDAKPGGVGGSAGEEGGSGGGTGEEEEAAGRGGSGGSGTTEEEAAAGMGGGDGHGSGTAEEEGVREGRRRQPRLGHGQGVGSMRRRSTATKTERRGTTGAERVECSGERFARVILDLGQLTRGAR